ncbi:unnamed protein product, partial [Trichogramma brassicae]
MLRGVIHWPSGSEDVNGLLKIWCFSTGYIHISDETKSLKAFACLRPYETLLCFSK